MRNNHGVSVMLIHELLRTLCGAEHAVRPTEARAHAAGLLLAEACLGASNGLHSRAPALLRLLLQEPTPLKVPCWRAPEKKTCSTRPCETRILEDDCTRNDWATLHGMVSVCGVAWRDKGLLP